MPRKLGSKNLGTPKKKGVFQQIDQLSFMTACHGGLTSIGIAYQVFRMKEETDDQLRQRIEIAIRKKRT